VANHVARNFRLFSLPFFSVVVSDHNVPLICTRLNDQIGAHCNGYSVKVIWCIETKDCFSRRAPTGSINAAVFVSAATDTTAAFPSPMFVLFDMHEARTSFLPQLRADRIALFVANLFNTMPLFQTRVRAIITHLIHL
jgi:hypothetical protein